MNDFVTVVVSHDSILTKHFRGPDYKKTSYADAFLYATFEEPVSDIVSLSDVLTDVSTHADSCVIRGRMIAGRDPMNVLRRKHERDGRQPDFEEYGTGHHWLMVDFDKVPAAPGLTASADRIEFLVGALPPAFHDASYHYQWSASAGIDGWDLLSCHVWFWLSEPWTDTLLTERIEEEAWELDESTIRTVQPNYTAAPIFEGCIDPVPERQGLVRKASDEVILPLWVRKAQPTWNGEWRPLKKPTKTFEQRLEDIGPRYHMPIQRAIASYVATTDQIDEYALKEIVRQRIAIAPPGANPKRDYTNDRYLNASIRGAIAKYRR